MKDGGADRQTDRWADKQMDVLIVGKMDIAIDKQYKYAHQRQQDALCCISVPSLWLQFSQKF